MKKVIGVLIVFKVLIIGVLSFFLTQKCQTINENSIRLYELKRVKQQQKELLGYYSKLCKKDNKYACGCYETILLENSFFHKDKWRENSQVLRSREIKIRDCLKGTNDTER